MSKEGANWSSELSKERLTAEFSVWPADLGFLAAELERIAARMSA